MQPERLGWPAIGALATLLWLGLWQRASLTVAGAAVLALAATLVGVWGADILLSTIAYYRRETAVFR